jgi:ubiquinone/menaquinone biosynthesis C-methylase UbiE
MTSTQISKDASSTDQAVCTHIPDYLKDTYSWAYLNPKTVPFLSSAPVVSMILWGNAKRLINAALKEVTPGETVLQPACVYGDFSKYLAKAVGPDGYLDIIDVAPIQLDAAKKRIHGLSQAQVRLGDASKVQPRQYDTIVCFFLLHEVPEDVKGEIVNALFASLKADGKLVFVDYHKPKPYHPLKPIMSLVFDKLEPFAKGLWTKEIKAYAERPLQALDWQKETFFAGLYQKVVVRKYS